MQLQRPQPTATEQLQQHHSSWPTAPPRNPTGCQQRDRDGQSILHTACCNVCVCRVHKTLHHPAVPILPTSIKPCMHAMCMMGHTHDRWHQLVIGCLLVLPQEAELTCMHTHSPQMTSLLVQHFNNCMSMCHSTTTPSRPNGPRSPVTIHSQRHTSNGLRPQQRTLAHTTMHQSYACTHRLVPLLPSLLPRASHAAAVVISPPHPSTLSTHTLRSLAGATAAAAAVAAATAATAAAAALVEALSDLHADIGECLDLCAQVCQVLCLLCCTNILDGVLNLVHNVVWQLLLWAKKHSSSSSSST